MIGVLSLHASLSLSYVCFGGGHHGLWLGRPILMLTFLTPMGHTKTEVGKFFIFQVIQLTRQTSMASVIMDFDVAANFFWWGRFLLLDAATPQNRSQYLNHYFKSSSSQARTDGWTNGISNSPFALPLGQKC